MPGLLIRNLPDALHRRLKERAAQNRRSMNQEVILLLENALGAEGQDSVEPPTPFQGRFSIDNSWLDNAKRSGRS